MPMRLLIGWRSQLAERLFGDYIRARLQEAATDDDRWWRSLTLHRGASDLTAQELREQQDDALAAYRTNPLAFRIVELTNDYVLGQGITVTVQDPEVQSFVNHFWTHPLNRMDSRLHQMCTELSLRGELFVTFHTNPYDGMTYIRCVPATQIDLIETNPNDGEDEWRFHQCAPPGQTEGRWWTREEMRHYAINRVVGTLRGQSDLAPLLPWLRRYKDWLTDRVIINKFKGAYLWDVTLTGASASTIRQRRAELMAAPPTPGTTIVHNEAETWRAVQPSINAESVEADGHALRLAIGAGAGLPLHFLAEGESTNRATAAEMGEPTRRRFLRRQHIVGHMIADIVDEVLRRAVEVGMLPRSTNLTITGVHFPDLTPTDNLTLAQALASVSQALETATARGWIDTNTARAWFYRIAGEPETKGGDHAPDIP